MSQVGVNSGAAAHALARFIIDNVMDDPRAEGIVLTQQPEGIFAAALLASATISLNGDVDQD
jgi:hypothetical protein